MPVCHPRAWRGSAPSYTRSGNRPRRTARRFRARGQGTRRSPSILPLIINRCTAPGIAVRSVTSVSPTCPRPGQHLIVPLLPYDPHCGAALQLSCRRCSLGSPCQHTTATATGDSFVATSHFSPSVRSPAPPDFSSLSGILPRSRPPSAPLCDVCGMHDGDVVACVRQSSSRAEPPAWGGFVFASE